MKWKLILAGLLLAGATWGQSEQWLEYHTGSDSLSYHALSLTTNPPAGVVLPNCKSTPYFARWLTPMDPGGGRWICFDRTHKSGPYDLMYIDGAGTGRLNDRPAVKGQLDSNNSFFPATPVTFKGEDGPITYHLAFRFYQYGNYPAQLLMSSAGWYEGTVDFGGQKKHIRLIDGNVNGAFNDVNGSPYDSDRVQIDGDVVGDHYLGRLIEVGGKFFHLEVARDGAFVKVQPAENVTLGTVHVPDNISEFTAYGENGYFVRKPAKGELTMPEGKYRIVGWTINRKDDKDIPWTMSGYNFPESATFDVAANAPATVKIGEPVQAQLKANEGSGRQLTFSLNFVGQQQEAIQLLRDGQRPRGPKLMLAAADGALCYTNTFEFG
ncbi:MAG TPA: hypothetical protein VL970_06045 [Candidatus Acidoferrales bacterium]|nr:hypothetical protein [Candidatus Acidoferrales bacterium]